jgi:HEAT repeat protein
MIAVFSVSAMADEISDALLSQNYRKRDQALSSLSELSPEEQEALSAELVNYLRSSDLFVSGAAADALTRIGPVAVPAVARHLETYPVNNPLAVSVLSRLDIASVPSVIKFLSTGDTTQKRNGLYILSHMRHESMESAVPSVMDLLKDSDVEIRQLSAEFITQTSWYNKQAVGYLIADLQDDNMGLRDAAVGALEVIGAEGEPAIPALLAGIKDTRHMLDKSKVIAALRAMNTDASWEALESIGIKRPASGNE